MIHLHPLCVYVYFSIVSTYLVHHGYCATAEAFAKSTGQKIDEEITSIKNRQSMMRFLDFGCKNPDICSSTYGFDVVSCLDLLVSLAEPIFFIFIQCFKEHGVISEAGGPFFWISC